MISFNALSSNYNNNSALKDNKRQISFKGYGAVPLKELYMQINENTGNVKKGVWAVFKELHKIGLREKIQVFLQVGGELCRTTNSAELSKCIAETHKTGVPLSSSIWNQDIRKFIKTAEGESYLFTSPRFDDVVPNYKMPNIKLAKSEIKGGNLFILKRDKEQMVLLGKDIVKETVKEHSCNNDEALKMIAKDLGVKPESIRVLSQPNFHLDMSIRPLKGNDILLNDYDLTLKLLKDSAEGRYKEDLDELAVFIEKYHKDNIEGGKYASADVMESELKELGFNVIRVPGVVRISGDSEVANFMNAIVHERKNGDLVYITNKCGLNKNIFGLDFNTIFQEHLMQKATYVKQVDFVSGSDSTLDDDFISYCLKNRKGGLHCMVTERPDFEKMVKF